MLPAVIRRNPSVEFVPLTSRAQANQSTGRESSRRCGAVSEWLRNRRIWLLFCTNVSRGIESPSRNAKERCCLGPGPPALRTERPEQRAGSLAGARVAHSVARDDMLGVALDWLDW